MIKFLKNYVLLILMAGGFISVIALMLIAGPPPQQASQQLETSGLQIITDDDSFVNYVVEIAKTPQEMKTGLMFRKEMPPNYGMLFVFDKEDERGFWMKNTLIPLDMIFIRADGKIHRIYPMAKPNDSETIIKSNGPVLAVLEINGGEAMKNGINVGDIVKHAAFGNNDN